ncbi:MAG: energy-coupling factor transporter transmembrane component T [bacterium]
MMNWLQRPLVHTHPLVKSLAYLHLCTLAIWGPWLGAAFMAIVCFVFLLLWPMRKGMITNPWASLILCAVAVVVVIPGGTQTELVRVSFLALRMLAVFLVSAVLGLVFGVSDVLHLGRLFHWPERWCVLAVGLVRCVPMAQRSMEAVMLSQRSRGFVLRWWGLVLPRTYRIVTIPFLVCMLRDALWMWVSLNMRKWAVYKPKCRTVGVWDVAFLLLTLLIWVLPQF